MCDVIEKMKVDEQYARGWVRLFGNQRPEEGVGMGQYALDLAKMQRTHADRCEICKFEASCKVPQEAA